MDRLVDILTPSKHRSASREPKRIRVGDGKKMVLKVMMMVVMVLMMKIILLKVMTWLVVV